jgi:NADH-quinone oxidoreductase subunit C
MKKDNIKEKIESKFADVIVWDEKNANVLTVKADSLIQLMEFLQANTYEFLADITSVDYKDKFAVIYQLYQYTGDGHLTVRVELDHDNPQVESLCGLWKGANWLEREVLDLMGIEFLNHPDPRRILLWDGYEGHPLRKDYVHNPSKYQGRRSIRK